MIKYLFIIIFRSKDQLVASQQEDIASLLVKSLGEICLPRIATKKITIGAGAGSLHRHRHPYGRRKTDWQVATKFLLPRLLGVLGLLGLGLLLGTLFC